MDDPRSGSKIIITGAADNLIMAWKDQRVVRTYEGDIRSGVGSFRIELLFLLSPFDQVTEAAFDRWPF